MRSIGRDKNSVSTRPDIERDCLRLVEDGLIERRLPPRGKPVGDNPYSAPQQQSDTALPRTLTIGLSDACERDQSFRLRFERRRLRLNLGEPLYGTEALGNRARSRRTMSPIGPSAAIADSIRAAAVRR